MKKYIWSVLLVLTTLTSCKISEGQEREPIDIGEYVASIALSNYKDNVARDVAHALILDWYLSSGDEAVVKKFFGEYEVVSKDTEVALIRHFTYANSRVLISFTTDGKLLSQGGSWVMNGYSGIVITIASKGYGEYKYTIVSDEHVIDYDVDIEVLGCNLEDGLRFSMNGYVDVDIDLNTDIEVLLHSNIKEAVEFHVVDDGRSYFKVGGINAICENVGLGIVDRVYIQFDGDNSCNISYNGFRGELKINESWLLN